MKPQPKPEPETAYAFAERMIMKFRMRYGIDNISLYGMRDLLAKDIAARDLTLESPSLTIGGTD